MSTDAHLNVTRSPSGARGQIPASDEEGVKIGLGSFVHSTPGSGRVELDGFRERRRGKGYFLRERSQQARLTTL